jgi:hypothetical protein
MTNNVNSISFALEMTNKVNNIYFFGGYRSSHEDVMAWKNSVEDKLPKWGVTPFRYPERSSAEDPLEGWDGSDYIADLLMPGDIIIGHSSGSGIANDVAEHALKLGKMKFKLIALDGFCPSPELLALPGTTVWSACSPSGIHSLNYDALQVEASDRFRIYDAEVEAQWPLHFSLVNLATDDEFDSLTEGYRNCDANLAVLGLHDGSPLQAPKRSG